MGKPEGRGLLGKPMRRWEDNIKMDLREVGCDAGAWKDLAQDRVQGGGLCKDVMNLGVPQKPIS